MKAQNNSILFAISLLLSGCASDNYSLYVETQRSVNRDYTMTQLAQISALVEIVKTSDDANVRIQAIQALKEIQQNKPNPIEQSKSWFQR